MVESMVTAAAAAITGVIRGAIIIAPMTGAVESVTTPYVAMTVASASRTMKFTICLFFSFSFEAQFALETGEIFWIEPVHVQFCEEIWYQGDHRENVSVMQQLVQGVQENFFSVD
jgi:hypothetical protein